MQLAVDHGVPEDRIVIDPGHDLNKNTLHTLELTRRLSEIADLGLPMLAAVSNKDFVGEATGLPRPDRMPPSIAAATICVLSGARILRMHDVAAAVAAARMIEAVLGFRQPAYLPPQHDLRGEPETVSAVTTTVFAMEPCAAGTGALAGPGPSLGWGGDCARQNADLACRRCGFRGCVGSCAGEGQLYQTVVDLTSPPAYACSCPSPEGPVQACACLAPAVE